MESTAPSGSGSGTTASSGSLGNSAGTGAGPSTPTTSSAPSIVDLTHDTLVRLPGAKDPVKYGDHYRGFQSEFTKKAQAAANAAKQVKQLQDQINALKRQNGQAQAGQGPRPNPVGELTQQLKSLAYLSGEDGAKVVEHLAGQFKAYDGALQQRDIALALMYKQMKQLSGIVEQLNGRSRTSDFDTKIEGYLQKGGYPPEAKEFAQELYLAYEGDDLDREFPTILKRRWDQLTELHKTNERKRIEAARRQPFVPGKGGNGTPSKGLANMAKSSAKEIADAFWPNMVDGDVET